MDAHFLSPWVFSIFIVMIMGTFWTSLARDNDLFSECNTNTYSCGPNIRGIRYPFWGDGRPQHCGRRPFNLTCHDETYPVLEIDNHRFRVLDINQSRYTVTMARLDLWDDLCGQSLSNVTLNESLFDPTSTVRKLYIFYNCTDDYLRGMVGMNNFTCGEANGVYVDETFLMVGRQNLSSECDAAIEVPVQRTSLDGLQDESLSLQEALNRGFDSAYNTGEAIRCSACVGSGGLCGSDSNTDQFVCLCRDQPQPQPQHQLLICQNHGDRSKVGLKIGIGFAAAGGTLLFVGLVFLFYRRRNKKKHYATSPLVSRNISYPSSSFDLEQASSYMGVQMFSYSELEEATDNFDSKEELGSGGFGIVYKGKLRDGRTVAIKRLFESNYKRVEQFMNEVEILKRLRHRNLVSLYGCTSRHCRELILVYEYIPNGTVADHLHGEQAKPGSLTWATRMNIAVETAAALAYLHASDVIHRDVKTNNILLDQNFSVKVADFGLSRFFPNNVTHVSTAPQGTPGYVDPEYHQCYHLTEKSDVYSFGVVLFELISSLPAVDITRNRHEINLSNMAVNKIQTQALHELVDPSLGFESDDKVNKMISAVAELAFQCLHYEREMRPTMEVVLEGLKGIQKEDYHTQMTQVHIPADDDVLLKSDQVMLSPDSVTTKWISVSTTSSSSN